MPKSSGTEAKRILQVVGHQKSLARGHPQSRISHAALQRNDAAAVLDEAAREGMVHCERCLHLVAEGQGAAERRNGRVQRTTLTPVSGGHGHRPG